MQQTFQEIIHELRDIKERENLSNERIADLTGISDAQNIYRLLGMKENKCLNKTLDNFSKVYNYLQKKA